jgi:superfamily II DNA helicase RecQ
MKTYKIRYIGERSILNGKTIGFLSSSKISLEQSLKCKEWVRQKIENNEVIICGNINSIEREIVNILLDCKQLFILVLANGFRSNRNEKISQAIDENRILILTPFEEEIVTYTKETAHVRNRLIIKLSKELYVGTVSKGGNLDKLHQEEIYSKIPKEILQSIQVKNLTYSTETEKQLKKQTKPKIKRKLPEIEDLELFEQLRLWRLKYSNEIYIPPFKIFSQTALIEIANKKPLTMDELLKIKGVGKINSRMYGECVFDIIRNYNRNKSQE